MPDRRRQIELLLAAIHDVTRWFPRGALRTNPRFAPVRRAPCPDCAGLEIRDDLRKHNDREGSVLAQVAGRGVRFDSFKREQPCVTCGGYRDPDGAVVRGSGWVRVDPMDPLRKPISSTDTTTVARPRMVKCDRCQNLSNEPTGVLANGDRCPSCDGTGERPVHKYDLRLKDDPDDLDGEAPAPLDAFLDKLAEDEAAKLLREVEAAHRGIVVHVNKPVPFSALSGATARVAHDVIYETMIVQGRRELTEFEAFAVDLGIAYIGSRLPDPLVMPRWIEQNAKTLDEHRTKAKGKGGAPLKVRDAEIRKHAKAGRSPQWIAAEYGLHVSTVYEIVNGKRQPVA